MVPLFKTKKKYIGCRKELPMVSSDLRNWWYHGEPSMVQ